MYTSDGKRIVIANQNGKKVERINVDWEVCDSAINRGYVHSDGASPRKSYLCNVVSGFQEIVALLCH